MFLLILSVALCQRSISCTLHSTMFLLILYITILILCSQDPLHSTMFLLIHKNKEEPGYPFAFTFHNVSINTRRLFIPTIQI